MRERRAHSCMHMCGAMIDGELAHSCLHGEGPHHIKVCVTKKMNKAIWNEIEKLVGRPLEPSRFHAIREADNSYDRRLMPLAMFGMLAFCKFSAASLFVRLPMTPTLFLDIPYVVSQNNRRKRLHLFVESFISFSFF
jgi:hypothetical protein